jgi:hypothetical protein
MEWIAYVQSQPPALPAETRSDDLNTAGWGTILWIAVLGVVFFALLAAAGMGLLSRRTRQ